MSRFREVLTACMDHLLAPSCAFDTASDGCCDTPSSAASLGQQTFEWHNNFGTAADFQVPAEDHETFKSWDWSTMPSPTSSSDPW